MIDMQRVLGEPDSPWAAPRFAQIVDSVTRLVDALSPSAQQGLREPVGAEVVAPAPLIEVVELREIALTAVRR